MIFNKDLEEITEDDLNFLIRNEVAEDEKLEYKEYINLDINDHQKKLLKEISAFSNSYGGLLILGIREDQAIAVQLTPYEMNPDVEKNRIIQIINSNSDPPITNIKIESLRSSEPNKYFILIKIPRSWNSPHRIKLSENNKEFYIRTGSMSVPMNIFQLKTAFNLSETLIDTINRFREDRISKILIKETPVSLLDFPKAVLHLIPINAFYPGQIYQIDNVINMSNFTDLRPIYNSELHPRINFDGFLNSDTIYPEGTISYIQLYRNGIIETVSTQLFDHDKKEISRGFHEKVLVKSIYEYLDIYKKLNVEMPVFIFITLLGMKGYSMYKKPGERLPRYIDHKIDRDVLNIPEIIIEDYDVNIGNILKPAFDSIWHACGHPQSENYNRAGEWSPK